MQNHCYAFIAFAFLLFAALLLSGCAGPEPEPGAVCGNNVCEMGEAESCPGDCEFAPVCGDGACGEGETHGNCPGDCEAPVVCGDGECDSGETAESCHTDCAAPDSCTGNCNEQAPSGCWCDPRCLDIGDCCPDACDVCASILGGCKQACPMECIGDYPGRGNCTEEFPVCANAATCEAHCVQCITDSHCAYNEVCWGGICVEFTY